MACTFRDHKLNTKKGAPALSYIDLEHGACDGLDSGLHFKMRYLPAIPEASVDVQGITQSHSCGN